MNWDKLAKEHGSSVNAVNFDKRAESLEHKVLIDSVSNGDVVCDLGCGNGRLLLEMAKRYPDGRFYGVDSSVEMIAVANNQKFSLGLENIQFIEYDADGKNIGAFIIVRFDKIITKRLLINMKGEPKYKAIENIHRLLKDDGIYLMTECFIEPLARINTIRHNLGLDKILVKSFNEYLSPDFINEIGDMFIAVEGVDFNSDYYFMSRIFNAYLARGEPDYDSPINDLAIKLSLSGVEATHGYSPQVLYKMRKRTDRDEEIPLCGGKGWE